MTVEVTAADLLAGLKWLRRELPGFTPAALQSLSEVLAEHRIQATADAAFRMIGGPLPELAKEAKE